MTNHHDDTSHTEPAAAPDQHERSLRYWIRATDALIARDTAERFAAAGSSRRDLRILTALSDPAGLPERLRERLERGGKRLAALADRGWIERGDGGWRVTAAGTEAKERLATLAQETQDRVADAASAEDLATTRATLEALAREFGWTEDTRLPRRGWRGHREGLGSERCSGHGHGDGPHPHGGRSGRGRGHGHWPGDRRGPGYGSGPVPGHDRGREWDHGQRASDDRGHGCGCTHGTDRDARGHRGHRDHRGHGGHGAGRTAAFERGFTAGFTAAQQPDLR